MVRLPRVLLEQNGYKDLEKGAWWRFWRVLSRRRSLCRDSSTRLPLHLHLASFIHLSRTESIVVACGVSLRFGAYRNCHIFCVALGRAAASFMVSCRRKRVYNGRERGQDRRFLRGFGAQEGVLRSWAKECLQEACNGVFLESYSLLSLSSLDWESWKERRVG